MKMEKEKVSSETLLTLWYFKKQQIILRHSSLSQGIVYPTHTSVVFVLLAARFTGYKVVSSSFWNWKLTTNNKSNASDFRFHSPLTILEDGQIGSSGYHWSETDNEQNKTTGGCHVFCHSVLCAAKRDWISCWPVLIKFLRHTLLPLQLSPGHRGGGGGGGDQPQLVQQARPEEWKWKVGLMVSC